MKSADDVRQEREMLEFAVDEFLRQQGWRHTSDLASAWLWTRVLADGRVLYVNKETALGLTASNDLYELWAVPK